MAEPTYPILKTCPRCGLDKLADDGQGNSDFYQQRRAPDGLQPACKRCTKQAQLATREHNSREPTITNPEYQRVLAAQGGVCGACHFPEQLTDADGQLQPLAWLVRGPRRGVSTLLCRTCLNAASGMRFDPAICFRLGECLLRATVGPTRATEMHLSSGTMTLTDDR